MSEQTKVLAKLSLISKEIGYVQKDKKNTTQGYKYLSESKIKEVMKENFEKHGIVFTYSTDGVREYEISPTGNNKKQFVTVVQGKYRFSDSESGEYVENTWAGTGSDTGDKGIYKAITGGIKYIFNTTFLIPTGDDPEEDKVDEKPEVKKVEQPIQRKPSKFTDEQKALINKVKEIFNIKLDSDLNKYVKYWADINKKTGSTYKDITPENITNFCEFTLKEGNKVNPF